MKKKPRKGSKIEITINGKPIMTKIDENGTQRLPRNKVFRWLIEDQKGKLRLNDLWRLHGQGAFTKQEIRELYQNIGYSVCGYSEIFPKDRIENPLWD